MSYPDPDDFESEASGVCAYCGQPLDRPVCAICAEVLPYVGALCVNAHDLDHAL